MDNNILSVTRFFIVGTLIVMLGNGCGDPSSKKNGSVEKAPTTEQTEQKNQDAASKALESELESLPSIDAPQMAKAEDLIAAYSQSTYDAIKAEKLFKTHCALCHGFKGNANINGAKDLTISKISLEESVAQVYFGKGLMTPFQGVMKDDDIVAVCKYAEGLRN